MCVSEMQTADQHIENSRVTVVGLGKSGLSVARFCRLRGARVTVTDMAAREQFTAQAQELEDLGVRLEFGGHRPETIGQADLVVLSPGVPHAMAPLNAARDHGVPVVGEIELAARYVDQPIIAVTGTNGKTTTTELLGEMLRRSGYSVFVGGNIGTPLIDYVAQERKQDRLVIEISSFQLDTIERFRPQIGLLLNVSPDHLDRYPDFAAYSASKRRLFANQSVEDIAVLNADDACCRKAARSVPGQVFTFSTHAAADVHARIADDQIDFQLAGGLRHTIDLARWQPVGRHNRENAAAAGLAALCAGATPPGLQTAINNFQGLAHRLHLVRTLHGIRYYDDSKATNVDAVCRALEGLEAPLVLIMGGRDKGGSYQALETHVADKVRTLVVMGEAAANIAAALGHLVLTLRATDMTTAVRLAADQALSGDVVLLSPACASFDMYQSYHQRGDDFCRNVRQLT